MNDPQLKVSGVAYEGWTNFDITTSVDHASGEFRFGSGSKRKIVLNAPATVTVGATPVITGFVDHIGRSHDKSGISIDYAGRDMTADLVDCSAEHESGAWREQTMDTIVRDLIGPFGVKLSVETDVGAPFDWTVMPGETVWQNIERMARQRGLLVMSNGRGGLRLARPSAQRIKTALILGVNIMSGSGSENATERFAKYVALGQFGSPMDGTFAASVGGVGIAIDPNVRRGRTLIFHAEEGFDSDQLTRRAQWEANVRRGRGLNFNVATSSWFHADGLWVPDRMVYVRDEILEVDGWFYIRAVTYSLDEENGSRAILALTRREAFDVIAIAADDRLVPKKSRHQTSIINKTPLRANGR